jgi:hypothetical protein
MDGQKALQKYLVIAGFGGALLVSAASLLIDTIRKGR